MEKFQLSGKTNPEILWFCVTSFSDWFRIFAPVFLTNRI